MREVDSKSFIRLATKRTNNAIKNIRLIGNLSSKSNYSYLHTDVDKILNALREEINDCEGRFYEANKKIRSTFTLE